MQPCDGIVGRCGEPGSRRSAGTLTRLAVTLSSRTGEGNGQREFNRRGTEDAETGCPAFNRWTILRRPPGWTDGTEISEEVSFPSRWPFLLQVAENKSSR